MRRTTAIVVSVILAATLFGVVLTRRLISTWHPEASVSSGTPALFPGAGLTLQFSDKPIDLPRLTLTDLDGHPISAAQWKGKVLLVNFWATWCGPCREEIPALVALQKRYADHLVILGLSIDTRPVADVKQFVTKYAINYPVAIVGDDVVHAFGGVPALPSTFMVDPNARIVQRHMGMLDPARTEHEVRALAGLPTEARVAIVKDTGQVLLGNAAYATEIPGVDLTALGTAQKEAVLTRMNTETCTCGCGLTVAQCRINDPSCDVSLPVAKKIVADAAVGDSRR
ncbi:MAG: TlpA disulfide reductase family protein [Vicinamibacterales bacterium]